MINRETFQRPPLLVSYSSRPGHAFAGEESRREKTRGKVGLSSLSGDAGPGDCAPCCGAWAGCMGAAMAGLQHARAPWHAPHPRSRRVPQHGPTHHAASAARAQPHEPLLLLLTGAGGAAVATPGLRAGTGGAGSAHWGGFCAGARSSCRSCRTAQCLALRSAAGHAVHGPLIRQAVSLSHTREEEQQGRGAQCVTRSSSECSCRNRLC